MAGTFRTTFWDPLLIISQIVCLQSAFYSAETTLMLLWSIHGYRPSLSHVFSMQSIHPMVVIQLLAITFCAFLFPIIVGRARSCLDFTITLHFLHFLLVCFYNRSIPTQFTWWLLQVINASVCTIFSEWLCSRREIAEIPLTQQPSSQIIDA